MEALKRIWATWTHAFKNDRDSLVDRSTAGDGSKEEKYKVSQGFNQ
jgi:hypothetical protein